MAPKELYVAEGPPDARTIKYGDELEKTAKPGEPVPPDMPDELVETYREKGTIKEREVYPVAESEAEEEQEEADPAEAPVTNLDIADDKAAKLTEAGILTVGELAEADAEELPDGVGPATVDKAEDELE